MRRPPPPEWVKFLKGNGHDLAQLTGADWRVLAAIDACWQALTTVDHREPIFEAVRALLPAMQQKCWPLARELIARALDWSDRERLWMEVMPDLLGALPKYRREERAGP